MRRTTLTLIVLVALTGLAVAAVSSASTQRRELDKPPSQCPCNGGLLGGPEDASVVATSSHQVKVRITGANNGQEVTNGGVAGIGRFSAAGAITDNGTAVAYRTLKAALITLRFVNAGAKGTITFVVKIDTNVGTSRWTITSGTKAYKGLHGKGIERENVDYTVSTLTGTVWR